MGNQNAVDELQQEMVRLTQELEEAMPSLDYVLEAAKNDMEAEIQRANDAFFAVIDKRLDIWAIKSEEELLNAKWQEDSYYRYGLIKLL